jgi:hypothetical protein
MVYCDRTLLAAVFVQSTRRQTKQRKVDKQRRKRESARNNREICRNIQKTWKSGERAERVKTTTKKNIYIYKGELIVIYCRVVVEACSGWFT